MTGLTVTEISPPEIVAWQITTSTAQNAVAAINTLLAAGYKVQINPAISNGVPAWSVTLMIAGSQPLVANNGDWIVYNGAQLSTCTNAQFVETYTAHVDLVWAATTVAPVAAASAGLQATFSAPIPTSANGPWTFTCALTNTAGDITTETISDPVIVNGQVVFTTTNLIDGDAYTAEITCDTQYDGVTATSVPSGPVTAQE